MACRNDTTRGANDAETGSYNVATRGAYGAMTRGHDSSRVANNADAGNSSVATHAVYEAIALVTGMCLRRSLPQQFEGMVPPWLGSPQQKVVPGGQGQPKRLACLRQCKGGGEGESRMCGVETP
jgi:hypothetical protein